MRLLILVTLAALPFAACNRDVAKAGSEGGPAATAGRPEAAASAATVREETIPAGTELPIVLDTSVSSNASRAEQPVHAHLARAIIVRGVAVVPAGSRVSGVVADATESGRVKGRAHLALRFESLVPSDSDERYTIHTAAVDRTAPGTKKKDALEIAGPAAGGALIGALVGGKKGALVGTAAGGGAGTAIVLSTRGKEVSLAKGSALRLRLTEPVTVKVRG